MEPAWTHDRAQRLERKSGDSTAFETVLQVSAESVQPAAVWSRRHLSQRRVPQRQGMCRQGTVAVVSADPTSRTWVKKSMEK